MSALIRRGNLLFVGMKPTRIALRLLAPALALAVLLGVWQAYASLAAVSPPSPTPRHHQNLDSDSDSELFSDKDLSFDSGGSRILF